MFKFKVELVVNHTLQMEVEAEGEMAALAKVSDELAFKALSIGKMAVEAFDIHLVATEQEEGCCDNG